MGRDTKCENCLLRRKRRRNCKAFFLLSFCDVGCALFKLRKLAGNHRVATTTSSFLARKRFQPMSGFPDDVMFWLEG